MESEINADLKSAKLYLEDTYIESISAKAAETPVNETADPVEGTPPATTPAEPQHKFDEDIPDDGDSHVEHPADGVTVTIKDGKKDADGNYVYVQSNVIGGKLNVSTVMNEKVSADKGLAFTSSTVFLLAGELGDGASQLFVFESDLTVGAGTHKLVFTNAGLSLHSFALDIYVTDAGLVIADAADYPGLDKKLSAITVAGINSANEFNLRVELYRMTTTDGDKLVAKIYVNDVYVGISDAAAVTSRNKVQKYDIEAVAIYHDATAEKTSISFDNVYATLADEDVVYIPEVLLK